MFLGYQYESEFCSFIDLLNEKNGDYMHGQEVENVVNVSEIALMNHCTNFSKS